jgi:hypothetical protein
MSDELKKFQDLLKSTSKMAELDKFMGDVDPIIKLTESLHVSAAIVTFAEMAKAYGSDADKFIDRAISLWESQLDLTFQVLDLTAMAVKDEDFRKSMLEIKDSMRSKQAAIADGFRKHIHEVMEGKNPSFDLSKVNFMGSGKPPEC